MVSMLDSGFEQSGFKPWPGKLCCVLGQDTLVLSILSWLLQCPVSNIHTIQVMFCIVDLFIVITYNR